MTSIELRMPFYHEMSRSLRRRRESLNVSLKQLSRLTGLSLDELREVESGAIAIEAFPFFKIMEALDKVEGIEEKQ